MAQASYGYFGMGVENQNGPDLFGTSCKNCGAPWSGSPCAYCGTGRTRSMTAAKPAPLPVTPPPSKEPTTIINQEAQKQQSIIALGFMWGLLLLLMYFAGM